MDKCGQCVLGVLGGAICATCNGTTFIQPIVEEKKSVKKK